MTLTPIEESETLNPFRLASYTLYANILTQVLTIILLIVLIIAIIYGLILLRQFVTTYTASHENHLRDP
ncbi:MAG: hypothetical protein LRY37_00540 [Alkalibacterium thalassium]|nr:hypothetical protein [Alkalibacterium thalassium]